MKKAAQILAPLKAWFVALGRREQIMVGIAGVLVPIYLLAVLVIMPAVEEFHLLHERLQTQHKDNAALQQQITALKNALSQNADSGQQQEFTRLQRELSELYTGVDTHLDSLIAPEQMPTALRRLLHHHPGLTLHSIKNAPAQTILSRGSNAVQEPEETLTEASATANDNSSSAIKQLYRQPLILQITGPYLDVLAYLNKIHTWPERMFIDSVAITIEEYPDNMITLQISSISTAPSLLRGSSAPGGHR